METWKDYHVFTEGVTLATPFSSEITNWWRRRFGPHNLHPYALCRSLSEGLPPEHLYFLRQIDPKSDATRVELLGNDGGAEPFFLSERSIEFAEDRVHLNYSDVRDDCQDRGFGTSLVRNCFRLARLLNLSQLAVNAIQAGSYVWARAAFLPTAQHWSSLDLKAVLLEKLDGIPELAWETYVNARNLIASSEVESIWALSDIRNPVDSAWFPGTKVPLGRFLLAESGISWRGTLNLDDPEQVERAKNYLSLGSED